ncbi:T9SS type A sorting domain-containing protein [Ferruginibacter sp. SUN002]|uniref:T9SS type A sorting domain-containing protein n=1 Tax=Ferruginibacter sp. SUN002 TaxID=2937789 RepID=UPI003D35EFCE
MKKLYALFFITLFFVTIAAKASIITIAATNFQFSPSNVNVNVGDVIHFTFSGFHNASSNGVAGGVPIGATAIFSGSLGSVTSYDYTVTAAGTYKYVCELHGDAGSFTGMRGQFTASTTTPVILNKFNVVAADKKALLNWTTATEVNTDHFSVRRSTDGINFTEIAKVKATGSSTAIQNYSYTDNNVGNSRFVYYELAIVDEEGGEKLSEIKMFKNTHATNKLITKVSPNPITRPGQLMVYFNADKAGSMNVKVLDAAGKLVYDTDMSALPGLNSGHVHVCDFNPGVYTLIFSMGDMKETKRVVVN